MNPLWQLHFVLLLAILLGMPILRNILNLSKASRTSAIVGMWCLAWLTLLIELFALPLTSWLFPLQLFTDSEWLGTIILGFAIGIFLLVWGLNAVFDENGSTKFWQSIWLWHERILLRLLPNKFHDEYHWHIRWRFFLWARKLVRHWQQFSLTSFLKRHRWLWVLLSGGVTTLFTLYIVTNGKWFTLPQAADLKALSGSWTVLTPVISAPIAFVIWWFRDTNTLWQIENQRKDINLKDFQKLAEWASGLHLVEDKVTTSEKNEGEKQASNNKVIETTTTHESTDQPYNVVLGTPSRREGSASLQIAAVVQLQAFLQGEFGRHFEKPAFTLLTSIWLALMQKHIDQWTYDSNKPFDAKHEEMKKTANTPLAKAITYALANNHGHVFRDHQELLPGMQLPGMNCNLLSLYPLELDGLNLQRIQWQGADLRSVELQNAVLSNAELQGVDFSFAKLQGAHLVQANLQGSRLRGACLQGATLALAKLQSANLREAAFQNANLNHAELQRTCLLHAWLDSANLSGTKLEDADLTHAVLNGTDLRAITFNDETKFLNAITDDQTTVLVQQTRSLKPLPILTHATRVKLRDQNGLNLPAMRYEEFNAEWDAATESQRQKALHLAGTLIEYDTDPTP